MNQASSKRIVDIALSHNAPKTKLTLIKEFNKKIFYSTLKTFTNRRNLIVHSKVWAVHYFLKMFR